MMALLNGIGPRVALLVLLAIALGCLFFLFDFFVELTSSGGNDSPFTGSSRGTVQVGSGVSLISTLAAAACIVFAAGTVVLLRRHFKDHGRTATWVTVAAIAVAAAVAGLGLYLFISGGLLGGLPYGGVPYAAHQVEVGGMNRWALMFGAGILLMLMLGGVTKPKFSVLPLVLFLAAILALGLFGCSAVRGLNLFNSPSESQPAMAYAEEVNALRQLGPATAVAEALAAADPDLLASAVEGLSKLGVAEGATTLANSLANADPEIVATAVEALAESGDPEAASTLSQALTDVDPEVLASVVENFEQSADQESIADLAQALTDVDPGVAAGTVEALAESGDANALGALAEALAGVDEEALSATVEALAESGDGETIEALTEAFADVDKEALSTAAAAVAESGDPEAIGALAEALADVDKESLSTAVAAVAESGDDESIGALAEALADVDEEALSTAVESLVESGDYEAMAPLTQALSESEGAAALGPLAEAVLENDDTAARTASVAALGALSNPGALGPLAQALGDTAPEVRAAAEQALAERGASVSPLETGGSLVSTGGVTAGVSPSVTTRQASEPSNTPVFRVAGAARVKYLRTGVGDIYANGGWTQNPYVDLPYDGTGRMPALVKGTLSDHVSAGADSLHNPESALLAWPAEGHAGTGEPEEVTVFPVPPATQMPAGTLPVGLHIEYIRAAGTYRPFSATFRSATPLPEIMWAARLPVFTPYQLESATLSRDPVYTQLPDDVPIRIRELAHSITDGQEGPYRKSKAIESFLRSRYAYAFATQGSDSPSPGQDPVDWFLFDSKMGTCGQFSSAFVVLARSVGIPARIVSGWAVSPVDGPQTIHADQAHQWAEVAFNELGWVTFEPTASGGAPSRTPGFGDVDAIVEEVEIAPGIKAALDAVASENPGLASVIEDKVGTLIRERSPVVDRLAAEFPDGRQLTGQSAEKVLEAIGASTALLENGGTVIDWGSDIGWTPGTTAQQVQELPATPVFQVTGAPEGGYLRTATGDTYANGEWTQSDVGELPYEGGTDVASLIAGWSPTMGDSLQQDDLQALVDAEGGDLIGYNELSVSAHPMVGGIPAQGMPISQGVERISVDGSYDPLSATFSGEGRLEEYAWLAKEVDFSREALVNTGVLDVPPYTMLPDDLPKRVEDLARSITDKHDAPYLKAEAIETFLREEYAYAFADAESGMPSAGQDPVDWFLFDSKEGTSGQFSSAFAVLARSAGIPARVVSGWAVGESDETRTVFSNQAHQWAEVALQDVGWTTFDPTPAGGPPSRVSDDPSADTPPFKGNPSGEDTVTDITEWPTSTRLGHPFALGGTVASTSGVPVDGMEVEIFVNKKKEQGGVKVGSSFTRQGRFSLEILLPDQFAKGSYQIIAHAMGSPGYGESWSDPEIKVYSGTRIDLKGPADISVGTPVEFRGLLSEETGRAVAHQEVLVKVDGYALDPVFTNERGEFSVGVSFDETGDHVVTVELKDTGFLLGSNGLLGVEVTMPSRLELDEVPPGRPGEEVPISGTLEDYFGNPIDGQTVEISVGDEDSLSVVTDQAGNFSLDHTIDSEGTHDIGAAFTGDDSGLEPSEASTPATVGTPQIDVEPLEPAARDGELEVEGTVSIGGIPIPDTPVTVEGEEAGRTDENGAFSFDYEVPSGVSLGDMPLEIGAPALEAVITALAKIMSNTNLTVTPLEGEEPGDPVQVEAQLLDDEGKGIPDATIHYGEGLTAVTDQEGIAIFDLAGLDASKLSEALMSVRFDGDGSNLPATVESTREKSGARRQGSIDGASRESLSSRSSNTTSSSGDEGFNWLLWIGVPLGLVLASVVVYVTVRAARRLPAPTRRRVTAETEGEGEVETVPVLLELSIPELYGDVEREWQVGEQIPLRCSLEEDSGRPVRGAAVEVSWDGLEEPMVLITDRRGTCSTHWSANTVGTCTVTAHFAGDGTYSPVTASAEVRLQAPIPGHMIATRLDITLIKPAEDLPYIWGIGEQVPVQIRLSDILGQGLAGMGVTASFGESGQVLELFTGPAGLCNTSWSGTVPGTYKIEARFAGDERYAPTSARTEFEVVDFREEVVDRYNSFLPWVREREPGISDHATPREMEVLVVTSGMSIDQRALEVVIARFEEADYSLHEIDRPRFEAMYRARRSIVGD